MKITESEVISSLGGERTNRKELYSSDDSFKNLTDYKILNIKMIPTFRNSKLNYLPFEKIIRKQVLLKKRRKKVVLYFERKNYCSANIFLSYPFFRSSNYFCSITRKSGSGNREIFELGRLYKRLF